MQVHRGQHQAEPEHVEPELTWDAGTPNDHTRRKVGDARNELVPHRERRLPQLFLSNEPTQRIERRLVNNSHQGCIKNSRD